MEPTAIIYARVSTKSQADDELPIEGQLEQCRRKAAQLGAVVLREFVDYGVSGRSDRRNAFQEAVTFCRLREIGYFIAWNTARFFREHIEAPKYKRDLERDGTIVTYASVDFDRSTNEGWLTETIYEVFDELYSRQVSVDTMRGMIKNARDGFFNGGRVPFGYEVVQAGKRKRLQVNEAEASTVREIFGMYLGGYGVKRVAVYLNNTGLTRRGRSWDKNAVTGLLRNEVYAGRIVFNRFDHKTRRARPRSDWIVTQSHEPIIAVEDFDAVQETFTARSPRRVGGRPRSNFVFVGLLKCGRCGSGLQTESAQGRSKTYSYYNCRAAQKGAGCEHRRIPAADLDRYLIDFLTTRLFTRDEVAKVIDDLHKKAGRWIRDRAKRRELIARELSGIESRLSNLYGVLELKGVDAPHLGDLAERLRELKQQRSKLENQLIQIDELPAPEIRVTQDDVDEMVGLFQSILSNCDDGRRQRQFFSTIVQEIVVGDAEVTVKYVPEAIVAGAGEQAVHSDIMWLPVRATLRTKTIVTHLPERFLRRA